MNDSRGKTLIIVEGEDEKGEVFGFFLRFFPEIGITMDDILIYGTNVFDLYQAIEEEYSSSWDKDDMTIDIPLLISRRRGLNPPIRLSDCINILLVFDFERQDPQFDEVKIKRLQKHFNNMTDDGLLFINYPMIESCFDMGSIPDRQFMEKSIFASFHNGRGYKNQIRNNSALLRIMKTISDICDSVEKQLCDCTSDDRRRFIAEVMNMTIENDIQSSIRDYLSQIGITENSICFLSHYISSKLQCGIHLVDQCSYFETIRRNLMCIIKENLTKAWNIENNEQLVPRNNYELMYDTLDLYRLLELQCEESRNVDDGRIWVICTVVLFFCEYKVFWEYV